MLIGGKARSGQKPCAPCPGTLRVFVPLSLSPDVCALARATVFGGSPGNSRSRERLIFRIHY